MTSYLLNIAVLEGKDLPACDSNGKSDPYCIIDLGKQHKKTKVCKKTLAPKWNETFDFNVDDSLHEFEIHIFDWDRWTTDDYIGDCTIPLDFFNQNPSGILDKWYPIVHKKTHKNSGQVHLKITRERKSGGAETKKNIGTSSLPTQGKKPIVDATKVGLASSAIVPRMAPPQIIQLIQNEDVSGLRDYLRDALVADVNKTDQEGYSALHTACMASDINKQEEMLTALLGFEGINVKATIPSDQNTPLHYLCQHFKSPDVNAIFDTFIKKGADVNAKNSSGETPLFKAIFNKYIRLLLVELLLEAGASVNIYNQPNGEGVLHYAVRLKRPDLVSILLEAGADITVRENKTKKTPLEIALESNNSVMAGQLQDAQDLVDWIEKEGFGVHKMKLIKAKITKSKLPRLDHSTLEQAGITDASVREKMITAGKAVQSTTAVRIDAAKKKEIENSASELDKIIKELDKIAPNRTDHITNTDLEFLKKLGSGASGDVYRGLYKGNEVAIKVLKEMMADKEAKEFLKETQILSTLRSPYIVYFFGICASPKLCMVMEFCSRGSLFHVMTDPEVSFGWEQFFHCAIETASGIDVLHKWTPQIMHRDLKSLNLLVTSDWHIKLCDFGLSRFDVAENIQTMCKMRGTMAFCAPEVYEGKRFTPKSDMYSLGIVLWEMAVRVVKGKYEQPYSEYPHLVFDFQIIIQAAQKDLRPTIPASLDPLLKELIQKCFSKNPDDRPNAEQFLAALLTLKERWEANKEEWDKAIEVNP
eukprot:TRINITY_DN1578_c0_g1_i1.p1 TRINITY_DN1578_c0_g1~~TRINITY_DN1578_c0_g1_i1.p1  ORF type:complete len:759 (+),score=197.44 TRINITY_DN1578_c0_g1_i1:262-2538(+)